MQTQSWQKPAPWEAWLNQLFNGRCAFCACPTAGRELCPGCYEDLPWISAACARCALPLCSGARYCSGCQSQPPAFDTTCALWAYHSGIDTLIKAFKLDRQYAAGRLLTQLAAQALNTRVAQPIEPLLAMPLHTTRLRERGFNQSQRIAHRLGPRVWTNGVSRIRATPTQRGLGATTRYDNLAGAFQVNGPVPPAVTIVDDVMTTGASAHALAQCLRTAGVEYIHVLVLARAI